MAFDFEQLTELQDSEGRGVIRIPNFVDDKLLFEAQLEVLNPDLMTWRDNHKTFINDAGRTIIQNYDVYSLRLSQGDQSPFERIPNLVGVADNVKKFVRSLGNVFPALVDWEPDDMSIHRYDKPKDVGLSSHRDHSCFKRIIAIAAIHGTADYLIDDEPNFERVFAGDLLLLRAPGLIRSDKDTRPFHSVSGIYTAGRISLTLRDDDGPDSLPERYHYENWSRSVS
ncbi:MAG: hypothetical protein WDN66_02535 [Candidatus Saccharibacteria bacterium]